MISRSHLGQKLWNYCNMLRDDGLSYVDYLEQLTFLLFLKMADEQSRSPFNKDAPNCHLGSGSERSLEKSVENTRKSLPKRRKESLVYTSTQRIGLRIAIRDNSAALDNTP